MSTKALLINYMYCTGCHSCETACKTEHGLPTGQWGIKLAQAGPWQIDETTWQYDYIPMPTDQCDLCAERVAAGKWPACVHHCQSLAMEYGDLEDLAKKAEGRPKTAIFVPKCGVA
jgi:anaerobic dimethyl sulfoxide reductase subunit B (iron-sulfur subunit)